MLLAPSSMGMVGLTKLPLASVWPTRSSVNWLAPPLTGEASGRFDQGLLRRHRRDARTAQRQNDRPYFPVMTMAAVPRHIDPSGSRSARPRLAAPYSRKFALPANFAVSDRGFGGLPITAMSL
jgi:hypothetical protein